LSIHYLSKEYSIKNLINRLRIAGLALIHLNSA
jgi:hypothetical protein